MQDVAIRRMGRPQSREEARMKYSIWLEASAGNSREQRAAPESVKPSLILFSAGRRLGCQYSDCTSHVFKPCGRLVSGFPMKGKC